MGYNAIEGSQQVIRKPDWVKEKSLTSIKKVKRVWLKGKSFHDIIIFLCVLFYLTG